MAAGDDGSDVTAKLANPAAATPVELSSVEEDPRLAPGTRLGGRYRIERYIASGGMGDVYEATDTEIATRLAIKTVHSRVAAEPQSMERVRREAQLARTVTDPHVCRIFGYGFGISRRSRVTTASAESVISAAAIEARSA